MTQPNGRNEAAAELGARIGARVSAALAPQVEAIAGYGALLQRLAGVGAALSASYTAAAAAVAPLLATIAAVVTDPEFVHYVHVLHGSRAANWPADVDADDAYELVFNEALPLVGVPRANLVRALVEAGSRQERLRLLGVHQADVLEDCRVALGTVTDPALMDQAYLCGRAADALLQGHPEAAQTLAVVVTETVISRTFSGSYRRIRELLEDELADPRMSELRMWGSLAPIVSFYQPWWPTGADPAPETLNRHVTVHGLDRGHYTQGHALQAVMLATSVLLGLQEYRAAQVRAPDDSRDLE